MLQAFFKNNFQRLCQDFQLCIPLLQIAGIVIHNNIIVPQIAGDNTQINS